MGLGGAPGGITDIEVGIVDDLLDVVITAPTSGQVLQYDAANNRWINAAAGGGGAGSVTSVSAGGGLSASTNPIISTGDIFIANTAVSAGDYTNVNISVNSRGQITAAANGVAAGGTVTSAGITGTNGIVVAGSPVTTQGVFALSLLDITPRAVVASGDISTTTGRVTASAMTVTALFTGATATYSGMVSANAGLRATTVSASGVIGASNLSGTNTGDQTITLQGDVTGTGTGTFTATIASASVTTGKMADIPSQTVIANATPASAQPKSTPISSVLDVLSSAQGAIPYRGAATWTGLAPGTAGQFLQTNGVSANPVWGTLTPVGNALYSNTTVPATNTIAATAGEMTIGSTFTVSGNTLAAGDIIKVRMYGVYSTKIASTPTLEGKVKFGATTMLDTGAITTVGGVTNVGWWAEGEFIIQQIGASANVESQGYAEYATAATTGLSVNIANTAPKAIDSTANQAVTVTMQWGAADASNSITVRQLTIEKLTTAAGPVASVSNSDSTLTISPTTGAVVASINKATANSWTGQQGFVIATLTDASAIAWNLATQQVARLTRAISGTGQVQDPTNMVAGNTYILKAMKASANTATLSFTSAYRWPGSTAPVLTTTSGAVDIFTFICDGSAMWGSFAQNYTAA